MKHSLIIILAFLFINIGAQSDSSNGNMVSKRGFTILPEAGDISVGIDASSLFSYVGGFFSNAGGGSPTFDYPQTFIGGPNVFIKYMLDANTAARIRFGHSSSVYNDKYAVLQSLTNPDPLNPSYVTDIVTSRNHSAVIAAGIQKYRGKGRLKGIYGAEVGAGFYQNSYSYNYGNDITPVSYTHLVR